MDPPQSPSVGDISSRIKQFEIRLTDQKEVSHDRFSNIENQLKEILKRLNNLEDQQQNSGYRDKVDGNSFKVEERLRKIEEKIEFLNQRFVDEKLLQNKFENFERMWKNSKERDQGSFQEDILNEINNIYSLLRKSFNSQRDIYFESQNIKKHIATKNIENETSFTKTKYEKKVKRENSQKTPVLHEKYERKSPYKYEQKSPKINNNPIPSHRNISPIKNPIEVFEESKRKIYQEM